MLVSVWPDSGRVVERTTPPPLHPPTNILKVIAIKLHYSNNVKCYTYKKKEQGGDMIISCPKKRALL